MKIRTGSFNIVFPNVLDMRENLFNLEKVFSNFMSPFNLMPIPNEAPPEFPRITATSKNGHSQLILIFGKILLRVSPTWKICVIRF